MKSKTVKLAKTCVVVFLVSLLYLPASAQSKIDTSKVYTDVDKLPEYPGGAKMFIEYVDASVAKAKRTENTSGIVVVVSTIEKDGSFTNCLAIKPLTPEADSIAINIARNSPKWAPAIKNGKPVRCKYSIIVTFGNPTDGPPRVKELSTN